MGVEVKELRIPKAHFFKSRDEMIDFHDRNIAIFIFYENENSFGRKEQFGRIDDMVRDSFIEFIDEGVRTKKIEFWEDAYFGNTYELDVIIQHTLGRLLSQFMNKPFFIKN
jgi:hypothetical protein